MHPVAPPTPADFIADASTRLDALCGQPLSPAEHELWRIAAQQNAALRLLLAGHQTTGDPT
jgi:hypothetical protein